MEQKKMKEHGTRLFGLIDIDSVESATNKSEQYLLLDSSVDLKITENGMVETVGLGRLDSKRKDLIELTKVVDPLECTFEMLGIFGPRTYVESLQPIPDHLTVQCLIFLNNSDVAVKKINELGSIYKYGKTEYDNLWVSTFAPKESCNDAIIIMNRRVGGWDGSSERPVIELLGAGGHVPSFYDSQKKCWNSLDLFETAEKELEEELGFEVSKDDLVKFGGFYNEGTSELVVLMGLYVDENTIETMQKGAYNNLEENTDGLYFGYFSDVMNLYETNASPFAGGEAAKPTNFPSNAPLMKRVHSFLKNR